MWSVCKSSRLNDDLYLCYSRLGLLSRLGDCPHIAVCYFRTSKWSVCSDLVHLVCMQIWLPFSSRLSDDLYLCYSRLGLLSWLDLLSRLGDCPHIAVCYLSTSKASVCSDLVHVVSMQIWLPFSSKLNDDLDLFNSRLDPLYASWTSCLLRAV